MHPSARPRPRASSPPATSSFAFEPNLDIDQIRDVEGNQVRLSDHRAPKETVDRYAQQMKAGAIFPAIVVNDRYEIVDGNTPVDGGATQQEGRRRRVRLPNLRPWRRDRCRSNSTSRNGLSMTRTSSALRHRCGRGGQGP